MAFAHEIYVALAAVVFFILTLADTGRGTPRRFALLLSAGAVLSALWAFGAHGDLFGGTYRVDAFSQTFKVLISLGFFIVVALGDGLNSYESEHEAEYYLFLSISVLGLTLLTSAMNLLTLYIALEVASYALYILVPLRRGDGSPQVEAAIKYILFGAAASGVSLFGISYVFGLAHTTDIATLVKTYPAIMAEPMGLVALSMMFASFFFKLAIFPFHVWTPDVYEGAANETSAIIATLPKIGAVAVLIRLTGMAGSGSDFTTLLVVLAALSMTFGNFAALVQTDVKRLLAFSSISHAGYMMTGILTNTITGSAS
ncbi:MAG: NADH-quinone oxidoreductase subunit N, partial [Deltaproteobacteria bacterium]